MTEPDLKKTNVCAQKAPRRWGSQGKRKAGEGGGGRAVVKQRVGFTGEGGRPAVKGHATSAPLQKKKNRAKPEVLLEQGGAKKKEKGECVRWKKKNELKNDY